MRPFQYWAKHKNYAASRHTFIFWCKGFKNRTSTSRLPSWSGFKLFNQNTWNKTCCKTHLQQSRSTTDCEIFSGWLNALKNVTYSYPNLMFTKQIARNKTSRSSSIVLSQVVVCASFFAWWDIWAMSKPVALAFLRFNVYHVLDCCHGCWAFQYAF